MRKASRRIIILELIAILWLGLFYSAFALAAEQNGLELTGLDPERRIQAIEHERLSGLLIPVQIGLGLDERYPGIGHLPAWNPYLGTGTPLVNDAFFYLFNPFMSLPILYLGAVQGSKVAIIIGFLIAGVNMWLLARAIGLGAVARVTVGAVYMMSGGIIGKFHEGHFQLGLSLIWPPLVFAGLWWTLHRRDRRSVVLLAVAFALLFFSANIYYTLHTLVCGVVIVAAHVIARAGGRWRIAWSKLRPVLIGGVLALGLVMIQFLPVWTTRDYVNHSSAAFDANGQLLGQYDLGVSVANLVTPWDFWQRFQEVPIKMWASVDYAYIGPAMFALILGLLLLAFVPRRQPIRHRHTMLIALLLAMVMMIWGAAQTEIVRQLYRSIPLLAEFRFLGRANAIAALWWIILAGIALDNLWKAARTIPDTPAEFDARDRRRLLRALALAGVGWLLLVVYTSSSSITRLSLLLNNVTLFNTLNQWAFTSYPQAMQTLVSLITLALIGETILLVIQWRFLVSFASRSLTWKKRFATRLIRLGLFILALAAISDVMHTNHSIIRFAPPADNFRPLYTRAYSIDRATEPFAAVREPWSPSAYDAYYSRVRNWGLSEGWFPLPLEQDIILKDAPKLVNMPRWTIAPSWTKPGDTSQMELLFVQGRNGGLYDCTTQSQDDPENLCDLDDHEGTGLYQRLASLPYAFVAPEDILFTHANTLTRDMVSPATNIVHQMDTIQLTAEAPDTPGQRYYLIVQETHFPGWQATVDGKQTFTATVGNAMPQGNDGGFIAVPMTQGTHTYTLHFEPPGFKAGIVISALTGVATLVYLAGFRWPLRAKHTDVIPVTTTPSEPAVATIYTPAEAEPPPVEVIPPPSSGAPPTRIMAMVLVAATAASAAILFGLNRKKAAIADSLAEVTKRLRT